MQHFHVYAKNDSYQDFQFIDDSLLELTIAQKSISSLELKTWIGIYEKLLRAEHVKILMMGASIGSMTDSWS